MNAERHMTHPTKRPRTIRVSDQLWVAFQAAADARDEIPFEEIRKMIERYVKKGAK